MLTAEPDTTYFIYPPGVEFWYRWEDLDMLLSNVTEALSADPNLGRGGWDVSDPDSMKSCEFIDGPCSGGIIYVALAPDGINKKRWAPVLLLSKSADLMPPKAMLVHLEEFPFHVSVLQPRNVPFEPRIKGSSRFSMLEGATAEHLAATKDDVYWLVTCTTAKVLKGVTGRVVDTVAGFNYSAEPLQGLPPNLREQATPLFERGGPHTASFRITGCRQGAGVNFAIMLYVGLLLRRKYGIRIRTMHLLATIEGAPTAWC